MTAQITDRDTGLARRLASLADAGNWEVAVGVLAGAGDADAGDGMTVLVIAGIHEFGAPEANIPERSFVRGWVDENRTQLQTWQKALAAQIAAGKLTAQQALEVLGARIAGGMQARIASGIAPPNEPSTVERKGSSTPLIDSGQLRSSLTWLVRRRGA